MINAGTYVIDDTIIVPPYVKIRVRGFAWIKSRVTNGATFWLTHTSDTITSGDYNKEQFFRGRWLYAPTGMMIKSDFNKVAGTVGIEIGSRTNLGGTKATARYAISGVQIQNFEIGLKLNKFHNYIGEFHNLHLEPNTTNVQFGDNTSSTVTNSGENFTFAYCTIAGADKAFDWFVDGMDITLIGCSIDFNIINFYMRRGWKKITMIGGHIEGTSERIATYLIIEANRPQITFVGTVIHCNLPIKFSGNISVITNDVRWESTTKFRDKMYVCTDDVYMREINHTVQGFEMASSHRNNLLRNGRWQLTNVNTTDIPFVDVSAYLSNFDNRGTLYNGITKNIPTTSDYTKALKITLTGASERWFDLRTETINVSAGDKIHGAIMTYQQSTQGMTLQIRYRFYDKDGTLLSTSDLFSDNDSTNINRWAAVRGSIAIVPQGATTCSMAIVGGNFTQNDVLYISELALLKS